MRLLNLQTEVRLNGALRRESVGPYREVNPAASTY